MAAFRGAVEAGSHALETDLHLSKDGVVMLSHDATLKRCFKDIRKVADCDWEVLRTLRTVKKPSQSMPRLLDLLEYLGQPEQRDVWLLLDIKTSNLPTLLPTPTPQSARSYAEVATYPARYASLITLSHSTISMAPNKNFSWTHFFPPKPEFTDNDISQSLSGKVYMVTGANCGMGKELARVLYSKGARVYITCRTKEKCQKALADIRGAGSAGKGGEVIPLQMDLADLQTVRTAAQAFLASDREPMLHGLFNNDGVMVGDNPGNTAQGYEEAIGVNCIGTFLFTQLLTPALAAAARSQSAANTVRVVWLSGFGLEQFAPEGRGVDLDTLDEPKPGIARYGISKAGVWLLAVEYARRHKADGIVSVAINPGNIRTELARNQGMALKLIAGAIVYPVIRGVYTQLYAVFSNEIATQFDYTKEWVIPFGRIAALRADLIPATQPTEEGGNGNAKQFWEWNQDKVQEYM
ncbi:NAD(P)-binding protein [Apiospora kogelbergensis]|uniref:NAD(P)-binding protein n=1 Tax=Apiospora kogelbergensis TaxID=1337665 RepID=UPI003131F4D5